MFESSVTICSFEIGSSIPRVTLLPARGRRVVIGGGNDRADTPWRPARQPQAFVRLRARHFVHQVAIDIKHRRAVVFDVHDMVVPKLVVKRARVQCASGIHTRTIMPSESGTSASSGSLNTHSGGDMKPRPNNAKTLQRRHFLSGAAGTLLAPLAVAQTASGCDARQPDRKPSALFIRATQLNAPLRPMRICCASKVIAC